MHEKVAKIFRKLMPTYMQASSLDLANIHPGFGTGVVLSQGVYETAPIEIESCSLECLLLHEKTNISFLDMSQLKIETVSSW